MLKGSEMAARCEDLDEKVAFRNRGAFPYKQSLESKG